jgi:hypothetical protein
MLMPPAPLLAARRACLARVLLPPAALLLAGALAAPAFAAGQEPVAADAPAGPNCLNRRDIRDLRLEDRRTLRVRMASGPDYLNRFDADCRFREGLDVWVFRSPTGLICAGEVLDIATRGVGRTGFCRLNRWEEAPREERPRGRRG